MPQFYRYTNKRKGHGRGKRNRTQLIKNKTWKQKGKETGEETEEERESKRTRKRIKAQGIGKEKEMRQEKEKGKTREQGKGNDC